MFFLDALSSKEEEMILMFDESARIIEIEDNSERVLCGIHPFVR